LAPRVWFLSPLSHLDVDTLLCSVWFNPCALRPSSISSSWAI